MFQTTDQFVCSVLSSPLPFLFAELSRCELFLWQHLKTTSSEFSRIVLSMCFSCRGAFPRTINGLVFLGKSEPKPMGFYHQIDRVFL